MRWREAGHPEPARSGARGGEGRLSLGPAPAARVVALGSTPPERAAQPRAVRSVVEGRGQRIWPVTLRRASARSSVDRDFAAAARVACAAEHALGAEVHDDLPVPADRDQAAVPAEFGEYLVQHLAHRLLQVEAAVLDRGAHVMSGHRADEILAVPGRRDRAHAVLGVGPGADDRRVPDASGALIGHPAGGGGSSQIAVAVQRHGSHRALRAGDQVRDALTALLGLELFLALRGAEVVVGDQRETLFQGELLGARTHQQYVTRLLHHPARELDRVSHVPHRGDRAGAQLPAVHDRGVELGCAVACQGCSVAGVERRVVLEYPHRGGDGIETAAAARQQRAASVERRFQAGAIALLAQLRQHRPRHRTCASVDGDRVHVRLPLSSYCASRYMAMSRLPAESRAPRNMPTLLKSMAMLPLRSTAITPPSPPLRRSFSWISSRTACASVRCRYCISEQMSKATTWRMKNSPWPVPDTAHQPSSA